MESSTSDNSILLKDLGYRLKREREQKGLSVDQVIQLTRISRSNIAAIEEGDLDGLPHMVYAKGFIRSYAEFLGIPSKEVDEVLDAAIDKDTVARQSYSNAVRTAPTGTPIKGSGLKSQTPKKSSWPTVLMVLILLAVLGWLVWSMQGGTDLFQLRDGAEQGEIIPGEEAVTPPLPVAEETVHEAPPVEEAPAVAPETEQEAPVVVANATDAPAQAASGGQAVGESARAGETRPGEAVAQPEEAGQAEAAEAAETLETGAAVEEDASAQARKRNSVVVTARSNDSCWMEVRADGGPIKEYFIQRGQATRFAYNESLWIRLGNAGGVTMSHNGQSYPLDSQKGQVKTIIFP